MSHGLQVQGAFTWSKTEDTSSGSFAGDNFAGDVSPTVPWWDPGIIKGLSDFNVGRNLVINALWQVPTPAVAYAGPLVDCPRMGAGGNRLAERRHSSLADQCRRRFAGTGQQRADRHPRCHSRLLPD